MATPNEAAPAAPAAEEPKTAKLTPTDQNATSVPPTTPSAPTNSDEKPKSGAQPAVSPKNVDEKSKTGPPPPISPKNDDKSKAGAPVASPSAAGAPAAPKDEKPKPAAAASPAAAPKDEKAKPAAGAKEKEEGSGAGQSQTGSLNAPATPGGPEAKQNTPVSGQALPNSHALALANAKAAAILCINPNKAVFSTTGGVSKHLMINKSNDRLAIKIRSSNNFFFRVNPVYSFLDGNSVNELEVIRLNGGGAKQDKLQLIYVICSDADTDPTKLFGLRAKVRSVILPITTALAN
uniref:Major sperm protein n=1 Tax=Panagrellus redivivus TaxID=6233 RepID=A0A7E4V6N7_PANRE